MISNLHDRAISYLNTLCHEIPGRSVGSAGNIQATRFFEKELTHSGWHTESPEFDAIDWEDNGAILRSGGKEFNVLVSPYSLPFTGEAELVSATTIDELQSLDIRHKIVLLHGAIAQEQLMPKNFVFYNPDEHKKIIELLEKGQPAAIISATGRNSALAGGVYPFPLIEDGDFDIPSVYMTEEEGLRLLPEIGKKIFLESRSVRIPGKGYNVIGTLGKKNSKRIVVTAHIDAKKGTPGAIDNATGVIVLLLLADLLKDYNGDKLIEMVAFNGEDYYAVPGQMNYVFANQDKFDGIILNINIDGVGYKEGLSAFSLFNLPGDIQSKTLGVINQYPGITEGAQWPQGDHSIFLQFGVPAIAVSSKWFIDNISNQDITHTPKDNTGIVNSARIVEIAEALAGLVRSI